MPSHDQQEINMNQYIATLSSQKFPIRKPERITGLRAPLHGVVFAKKKWGPTTPRGSAESVKVFSRGNSTLDVPPVTKPERFVPEPCEASTKIFSWSVKPRRLRNGGPARVTPTARCILKTVFIKETWYKSIAAQNDGLVVAWIVLATAVRLTCRFCGAVVQISSAPK